MACDSHIIAIAFPSPGHINPVLHVCKRLAAFGFKIIFANSLENHKMMFSSTQNPHNIEFIGIPDGLPEQADASEVPAGEDGLIRVMASADGMQPAFEQLVKDTLNNGKTVNYILSDPFIGWTQDIANKFGVPRVVFSTCSPTVDLVLLHLKKLKSLGFIPLNPANVDELVDFIPGLPALLPADIIPLTLQKGHPIVDYLSLAFERFFESKCIFSSTFEAIEADVIKTFQVNFRANYFPVGPVGQITVSNMNRLELNEEQRLCLEWLDSHKPASVLYVSFGSISLLSAEQLTELVYGLEASGQSFLLVLRPTLFESIPQELYHELFQIIRHRGYAVNWAPQLHVLRHAAVGGFLTHCGWNSTMESICAGVPMIGWPCMAEQNVNCKFLVDRKLALAFRDVKKGVKRDEVEAAVKALLIGEEGIEMRKRVQFLSDEAKKSVSEGGSSYRNLQLLMENA